MFDIRVEKSVFVSLRGADSSALTGIVCDEAQALLSQRNRLGPGGMVCVYDVRAIAVPVTLFSRLETGIQDFVFVHRRNGASTLLVSP